MLKSFYIKFAANNIKRNTQAYIPYILTCIGAVMMFYNMCFLANTEDIGHLSDSQTLRSILRFGAGVIGIFSVIFIFYVNSFLIKRRKKELGLFNIFGMEKRHIARIMFFETVIIGLICIASGILSGIILSKLMTLLLFKIVSFKVVFGFEISPSPILVTTLLFSGIFILNLIYNIFSVHLSKPIELLKASNVGEKEPKTKWLLTIIGIVCLGIGYYIALTTEKPLAAMNIFFVAVILVMIATYCLFTAGSIAFLKTLRKNKNYYYKPHHFIWISNMIYRMKQNAVGLANICILSTAVIVVLSTTISLYIGVEDILKTRYPQEIIITSDNINLENVKKVDNTIMQQLKKFNIVSKNMVKYKYLELALIQDKTHFRIKKQNFFDKNSATAFVVPLEDYNNIEKKVIKLSDNEVLLYTSNVNISENIINFNGFKLSIKKRLTSNSLTNSLTPAISCFWIIVKDIETMKKIFCSLNSNKNDMVQFSYYYGFDFDGNKDNLMDICTALKNSLNKIVNNATIEVREMAREGFYSIYGGLLFIGLFLGLLFIMATVLIIYYKQIEEGFDDRHRYEILQKVGMTRLEIKKSIQSQILATFFLPLFSAIVHIAFAFKIIVKMLQVFNLTNIPLYALCTSAVILVFAIFYTGVYALTAKTYYKIVS
ncbi:ABC transporter permease [Caldicellulosiruptor changbaiensis]|uniref:ABC transporter permease n=1 Tax=Caldicellulosiruptor changbaiensis TaxID=1222016 RepID=A0A3T0D895_9FIRM|nr:FtsX-like permease family protein [Caldicellulosiruptor changbaiensis]AZT91360.1 ABC transporter permease [Caldicellulosiruptor changbaiensis]